MTKNDNQHRSSSFDDFLQEEGSYDEANARAVKKFLAWQLSQALDESGLTRAELASKMQTSRATVNRMLDPDNPSLNLQTLDKAPAL